ncbi:MAG: hypothetical protein AABM40_14405 [Chloroflexota bacterium]
MDNEIFGTYSELVEVLRNTQAPRQVRHKAKPQYVFDQTGLIRSLRAELQKREWKRDVLFAAESATNDIRIRRVTADTLRTGVHAIFEFGNRSYYAYNLVTRVAFGYATGIVRLAVFVLPTQKFANAIDSNVVSFEQVAAEMVRLVSSLPRMVPGPMMLIGIEPENFD